MNREQKRRSGGRGRFLLTLAASLFGGPALVPSLSAQTFRGLVLGPGDEPVATALVRLEGAEGEQVAFALSDTTGLYEVSAPSPGEYVVVAERFGYEPFRSHPLAMDNPEGVYPVDILLRAAPLPIEGITVSADRLERIERGLRLEIGLNPRSLRVRPILRSTIQEHLDRGHNLTDMMRWSNLPSITVKGTCFQYRNRHCLPVYLNGQRMGSEWTDLLPLELAETVVILMPGETMAYNAGGVFLYSAAWIMP